MATEIERKFLLKDETWQASIVKTDHFRDGLISRFGGGKMRFRLGLEKAWLTIKGPRTGISRQEFEYEIPYAEADEMLQTLCEGPPIEKLRHLVPFANHLWAVDIHLGSLHGVQFAEIELQHPDEQFSVPPWAGAEITHDPQYRKSNLLALWASAPPQPSQTLQSSQP